MRIGFIGGGVMAEAIISGILKAKLASPEDIGVGEPMRQRRVHLQEQYGVGALPGNLGVVRKAQLVILSIKPQDLPKVMAEIAPALNSDHTVLSIIAGARIKTLIDGLNHPAVIRAMPNTPAQIGSGMTVWTTSSGMSEAMVAASREILRTLGDELHVPDEKLIDMATALSASGPAYVFLFIEALIDAGVYLGMQRDVAKRLVLQTLLGSSELVRQSGRHPAELKDMVTSPGGTTAEALLALERRGFKGAVLDAVIAAYEKSRTLGGPS